MEGQADGVSLPVEKGGAGDPLIRVLFASYRANTLDGSLSLNCLDTPQRGALSKFQERVVLSCIGLGSPKVCGGGQVTTEILNK